MKGTLSIAFGITSEWLFLRGQGSERAGWIEDSLREILNPFDLAQDKLVKNDGTDNLLHRGIAIKPTEHCR